MTTAVQRRRGTNTEHASFTGLEGELSVNTTNESVHVHDGSTAGGFELARADASNIVATSIDINGGTIDGTAIGASSASTGAFTTLTASGAFTSLGIDDNADATAITIDSSENVGIGNSSPAGYGKFVVQGTGNLINANASSGSAGFQLYEVGQGRFAIETLNGSAGAKFLLAGTERMRIDSSGNVGIGTTLPSNKMSITGFNEMTLGFPAVSGGASRSGIKPTVTGAGAGQLEFLVGGDNNNEATTVGMAIDSSGSVGIGNSSPSTRLTVGAGSGTEEIRVDAGAGWADVRLHSDATNGGSIYFNDGADAGQIFYYHPDNTMRFHTNASEKARLDSSGNLLLGCTALPSGGAGGAGFETGQSGGRTILQLGTTVTSTEAVARFYNPNGAIGNITLTGSTCQFNSPSDQRLKENIADADDAGSKIDAIQVRKYDWKADGSHQDYGMIAQELQAVAPEAVSGDADSEEMMGVDYSKLVPMLIKEIQSLRNRVAQLEE